jgi:hypothetical protein
MAMSNNVAVLFLGLVFACSCTTSNGAFRGPQSRLLRANNLPAKQARSHAAASARFKGIETGETHEVIEILEQKDIANFTNPGAPKGAGAVDAAGDDKLMPGVEEKTDPAAELAGEKATIENLKTTLANKEQAFKSHYVDSYVSLKNKLATFDKKVRPEKAAPLPSNSSGEEAPASESQLHGNFDVLKSQYTELETHIADKLKALNLQMSELHDIGTHFDSIAEDGAEAAGAADAKGGKEGGVVTGESVTTPVVVKKASKDMTIAPTDGVVGKSSPDDNHLEYEEKGKEVFKEPTEMRFLKNEIREVDGLIADLPRKSRFQAAEATDTKASEMEDKSVNTGTTGSADEKFESILDKAYALLNEDQPLQVSPLPAGPTGPIPVPKGAKGEMKSMTAPTGSRGVQPVHDLFDITETNAIDTLKCHVTDINDEVTKHCNFEEEQDRCVNRITRSECTQLGRDPCCQWN